MKSAKSVVIAALFASVAAIKTNDYGLDNVDTLVAANSDIEMDSRSANEYDAEATASQSYAQADTAPSGALLRPPINDEDGDGVEDNQHKTQAELDRYRKKVFGVTVEDLHNTHNGEYPGHVRAGEHPRPTPEPKAPAVAAGMEAPAVQKAPAPASAPA